MADAMQHDPWEYMALHIVAPDELNTWGDRGWELCHGFDSRNASGQDTQYCFFKRRKSQPFTAGERRLMEMITALSTKQDQIMSKLDDYIAAQTAFNADIASDFSTIQSNTAALNGQIATLTTELASASLTDSQSAALDALTAAGTTLQATADAAAGKTPPAAPAPATEAEPATA